MCVIASELVAFVILNEIGCNVLLAIFIKDIIMLIRKGN